ncbi:MAG: hypothetical protein ABI649_01590 [Gaiellaceae bacterium]
MIVALGGFALAVLLAWQVVVVGAALLVWRLARREAPSRAFAFLAAAILAAGLATFPLQLARAAKGARDARRIGPRAAELFGGAGRSFSVNSVERARQAIPPDATYFLDVAPRQGGSAMRFWTRGWLLPRIAVDSPEEADWIVSWREDPRRLGIPLAEVRMVGPRTWVARVQR